MPALRGQKWDWEPHIPRMLELYSEGESITKIWQAIQCDGFTPCLRIVYKKLDAMGYPTDYERDLRFGHTIPSSNLGVQSTVLSQQNSSVSMSKKEIPRTTRCVRTGGEAHRSSAKRPNTQVMSATHLNVDSMSIAYHHTPFSQTCIPNVNSKTRVTSHTVRHVKSEISNNSTLGRSRAQIGPADEPKSSNTFSPALPKMAPSTKAKRSNTSNTPEGEQIIQKLRKEGLISDPQHSGGRTKPPQPKQRADQPSDYHKFLRRSRSDNKLSSFFDSSSSTKGQGRQISLSSDNDSGYHSGRGTPSSLQLRDSLSSRTEPSMEFRGLHRVICHSCHEPQNPTLHRQSPRCHYCGCSSVHILAWSANHWKLQDFKKKLESVNRYEIQALDAAGNSALHYAAISGASYAHLKILIDAGVPLKVRNSASQNFLHCLRPDDGSTKICSDCFDMDLITLLKLVEPDMEFSEQDDDGQTVLHFLALYIREPQLRDEVFETFRNFGFPSTVLNRFGKSAKDMSPVDYKIGQTMFAANTFNTIGLRSLDLEFSIMSEWEQKHHKQLISENVRTEARRNPHHVDSMTKDSIFHALSRIPVKSRGVFEKNDILQDLSQFVLKGVSLNRHNHDGYHPLAAFICNQEFREIETGATMAKYIDALLWKDEKRRDLNDININMMNRDGATALYEAAVRAQSDTVRSLIEAGANVNARLHNEPKGSSILHATIAERNKAVQRNDHIRHDRFKNVISHLGHAGAVELPSSRQARGLATPMSTLSRSLNPIACNSTCI